MGTKSTDKRCWFVTGTSGGLGQAFATEILAAGDLLVATARKADKLEKLVGGHPEQAIAVSLDVTDRASIDAAVKAAVAKFGRIDVLVNNAGYGLAGAVEELEVPDIREVFDANFFGAVQVIQAVLPTMRQQRSGHILNISSMSGFVGSPALGAYCATKFALEGISEVLAEEVAPLGIKVTIVEPGPFRTSWSGGSMRWAKREIADYASTSGAARKQLRDQDGKQPGDPALAGKALVDLVRSDDAPRRLVLGALALSWIRKKLAAVSKELDARESVSLGVDRGGATTPGES